MRMIILTIALMLIATSCAPVTEAAPTVSAEILPSLTDEAADSMQNERPAATPKKETAPTTSGEATESALKSYKHYTIEVRDWMGDISGGEKIRELLLDELSLTLMEENERRHFFIGTALKVSGGWLVPAGLLGDGEIMPDTYYITENADGTPNAIDGSAHNLTWTLNKTCIDTPDGQLWAFYGCLMTDTDAAARPRTINLTDGSGAVFTQTLPAEYPPYMLAASSAGAMIESISLTNDETGEEISIELYNTIRKSDDEFNYVYNSEVSRDDVSALINGNLMSQAYVKIGRMSHLDQPHVFVKPTQFSVRADLYESSYSDGTRALTALPPVTMDELLFAPTYDMLSGRINAAEGVTLVFEERGLGAPDDIEIMCYRTDGTTETLSYDGASLLLPAENDSRGFYGLRITADYGEHGYISWVMFYRTADSEE